MYVERNAKMTLNTVFGILLIIVGIFNFFFPQKSWFLEGGFLFNNTPSQLTLKLRKVIGGLTAIFGIILVLI